MACRPDPAPGGGLPGRVGAGANPGRRPRIRLAIHLLHPAAPCRDTGVLGAHLPLRPDRLAGAQASAVARHLRRHRPGFVRRSQPAPGVAGRGHLPRAARIQPDRRRHRQGGVVAARLSPAGRLPADTLALAGAPALGLGRRHGWSRHGADRVAACSLPAGGDTGGGQQAMAGLEHLGPHRSELVAPGVQLDAELPEPARPQDRRQDHPRPVTHRVVLAGQRSRLLQRRRLAERQLVREPAHHPGLPRSRHLRRSRRRSRSPRQDGDRALQNPVPLHRFSLHGARPPR